MPIVKSLIEYIILPIFFVTAWDIAVITDDEIEFLQKGKFFRLASEHLKELSSGTYDPVNGDLYISDSNQKNASIFKINTLNVNNEIGVFPVVSKQSLVKGMVFDIVTSTLFWTTGPDRIIHKLVTHSIVSPIEAGEILHKLDKQVPMGIAVDSCRGQLFWTNCEIGSASIESSRIDGSDLRTIIKTKLYLPLGIVVDHKMKKLYWSDERDGVYYSVERSDLDGANREYVIQGTHHQPVSLSLAADKIYWADWVKRKLWFLPKNSNGGVEPEVIQSFEKSPVTVISSTLYVDVDALECPSLNSYKKKILNNYEHGQTFHIKGTVHDLYVKSENELSLQTYCLNNGSLVDNTCNCNKGFRGARCENSVCHNYCISGKCTISNFGQPICSCSLGFSGPRCEVDRCLDVCLNGGSCSIQNNKTTCLCKPEYEGDRCEFASNVIEQLCKTYCEYSDISDLTQSSTVGDLDRTNPSGDIQHNLLQLCSCPEQKMSVNDRFESLNVNAQNQNQHLVSELNNRFNVLITSVLGALCVILTIAVIFLTSKVYVLKKRPRIRKRIVVNKPLAPITCRPQSSPDQCEITIENCCNMNICETPCFEPEFRSTKATFSKRKSEDKKKLISSMHTNSSQDEDNY